MLIQVSPVTKELVHIPNSKLHLSEALTAVQLNPVEYDPVKCFTLYLEKYYPDKLKGVHDFFTHHALTHDNIWEWHEGGLPEDSKDDREIEWAQLIRNHFSEIFDDIIHQFEYINSDAMKDVAAFFNLPFPDHYQDIFEQFIVLSRTYENNVQKVEEKIDDEYGKLYIQWIRSIPLERLSDLTAAAIYFHIDSLSKLVGLVYAECIVSMSREDQEKIFKVPSHFQDSALKKISKELDRAAWMNEMKD